jgi:hypothetical protein
MVLLTSFSGISTQVFRWSIDSAMRKDYVIVALLLMVILTAPCQQLLGQFQPPNVTRMHLEKFGWQPVPKPQRGSESPGSRSKLISIDHNGRVLVGFTTRENYTLATREQPGLSFHILRFTPEGKDDVSLVLPTKTYFTNGFYLGQNDQIIARANDALQVMSEGGDARERGAAWRSLMPCSMNCWISQSPSQRTIIVSESKDSFGRSSVWHTNDSTYTILDTSSEIHILRTCTKMAFYGEKITDRFAYWFGTEGSEHFARRFPICDVDHPEELSLGQVGITFPLSDDAFLSLGSEFKDLRGVVELLGSDGHVKFRRELPKRDSPSYSVGAWATSDERGDHFAFIVETWRGGSRFFDVSGKRVARRIVVYNEAGQELASVPVSATYHRDFDFSLSPDGHRLAILDEGVLTVVDLN